jgi:hypothetical protein
MSKNVSKLTAPEHWTEWFKTCALDLCGPDTRKSLADFAFKRYKAALDREIEIRNMESRVPAEAQDLLRGEKEDFWRDLEGIYWYQPKPSEKSDALRVADKSYKKYYQENASRIEADKGADEARNYLEGSVSGYLVKTRCRSIITHALRRCGGSDASGNSLEETLINLQPDSEGLEDPANPTHRPDPEDSAVSARSLIELFSDEAKLVLYESLSGRSLDSSWLKSALGKRKGAIYGMSHQLVARLQKALKSSGIESEEAREVFRAMREILEEWNNSPEFPFGCRLGREKSNETS